MVSLILQFIRYYFAVLFTSAITMGLLLALFFDFFNLFILEGTFIDFLKDYTFLVPSFFEENVSNLFILVIVAPISTFFIISTFLSLRFKLILSSFVNIFVFKLLRNIYLGNDIVNISPFLRISEKLSLLNKLEIFEKIKSSLLQNHPQVKKVEFTDVQGLIDNMHSEKEVSEFLINYLVNISSDSSLVSILYSSNTWTIIALTGFIIITVATFSLITYSYMSNNFVKFDDFTEITSKDTLAEKSLRKTDIDLLSRNTILDTKVEKVIADVGALREDTKALANTVKKLASSNEDTLVKLSGFNDRLLGQSNDLSSLSKLVHNISSLIT